MSTEIIYYELAKITPDKTQIRPRTVSVDPSVLHCAQNYIGTSWHKFIKTIRPNSKNRNRSPKVHSGPIAVGEKVIADDYQVHQLLNIHPKIIGIEMESFGVGGAASNHPQRPRFISIRAVCDYADSTKNDHWHDYACATAAAYAIGFLRESPIISISLSPTVNSDLKGDTRVISIGHLSMQSVPEQSLLDAIQKNYHQAPLSSILIDQTNLYQEGCLIDPLLAAGKQVNIAKVYDRNVADHPDARFLYFGLAHIPLLFHLGFQLTNKRRVEFFEYNRYQYIWEPLIDNGTCPKIHLDGVPKIQEISKGDIVLRLSISNTIELKDIEPIIESPIGSIHLFLQPARRDVIKSTTQLHYFGRNFRSLLDSIHELFPNRKNTHMFYAGPVSLAVYLGQLIQPGIDRNIIVYNYTPKDNPRYSWGLQITEEPGSGQFLKTNISAIGEQ